ncbi:MAG: M23 family metallopeptidase [Chloroflexi bacterium]|nr:M23 family metallopeptidase [Chloroflexota bacterium]
MRTRRWTWLAAAVLLLAVSLGLAGCAQARSLAELFFPPTATPTSPPTSTPTATSTSTPTPTAIPTPTVTPTPTLAPIEVSLTLLPAEVYQGRTVLVIARTNRTAELSGTFAGQALRFVSDDQLTHRAFAGVSAIAELAPLDVFVSAEDAEGGSAEASAQATVVEFPFDYEKIEFTPEVGALLDPEITVPEAERLKAIFSQSSSIALWDGQFQIPYEGIISSSFGIRRLYDGVLNSFHGGLDIAGNEGDEILADATGLVVLAEALQLHGNTVIIDHGAGVFSAFNHLVDISVAQGDLVSAGQLIGHLGTTGLSTGPHLHWEIRVNSVQVDPYEWAERNMLKEE